MAAAGREGSQYSIVDYPLWCKIAGASYSIPRLNSMVLYFPQGHIEQCSDAGLRHLPINRPFILCRVISIQLLSHRPVDDIFVRFTLRPINRDEAAGVPAAAARGGDQTHDFVTRVKELSHSDVSTSVLFVPHPIANTIFPQFETDRLRPGHPATQNITMRDVHGRDWNFRHFCRSNPQRDLLANQWTQLCTAKRVIAGDSVVFVKCRSTGQIFVGIRRARVLHCNRREQVVAAMESAAMGAEFQVDCYPTAMWPPFVVSAEKVREASRTYWRPGMMVQTPQGSQYRTGSRHRMFQGTVQAVEPPPPGPFRGSPWRMLKVRWNSEDRKVQRDTEFVNPWDVVGLPSPFPFPFGMPVYNTLQNGNLLDHSGENDNQVAFKKLLNDVMEPK